MPNFKVVILCTVGRLSHTADDGKKELPKYTDNINKIWFIYTILYKVGRYIYVGMKYILLDVNTISLQLTNMCINKLSSIICFCHIVIEIGYMMAAFKILLLLQ